jgi:hypothetical protein
LCHVSVSSVKHSRHLFASSRSHPVLTPGTQERHETPTGGAILVYVRADGKRIESQIRSRVGVLVAFFDRRKASLNLADGRAKGAYAIRETAKIALHAD